MGQHFWLCREIPDVGESSYIVRDEDRISALDELADGRTDAVLIRLSYRYLDGPQWVDVTADYTRQTTGG